MRLKEEKRGRVSEVSTHDKIPFKGCGGGMGGVPNEKRSSVGARSPADGLDGSAEGL